MFEATVPWSVLTAANAGSAAEWEDPLSVDLLTALRDTEPGPGVVTMLAAIDPVELRDVDARLRRPGRPL